MVFCFLTKFYLNIITIIDVSIGVNSLRLLYSSINNEFIDIV